MHRYPGLVGRDMVEKVTTSSPFLWDGERRPLPWKSGMTAADVWPERSHPYKVVALDYGIKYNILRHLARRDCHIIVLPAQAEPADILALEPDGLFLSNGPGDPAAVPGAPGRSHTAGPGAMVGVHTTPNRSPRHEPS